MRKNSVLKKGDIIIISVLLAASLTGIALFAWQDSAGTQGLSAEIYQDGHLQQITALADGEQELRITSAAGYNVLKIGPEGVRILESDCHNQDCVRAGLRSRQGSIIACLPHRLLIRLSGETEADFDAISR